MYNYVLYITLDRCYLILSGSTPKLRPPNGRYFTAVDSDIPMLK